MDIGGVSSSLFHTLHICFVSTPITNWEHKENEIDSR